jgi:lipopolysaccharide transport system permease protein
VNTGNTNYSLFTLAALIPWQLFASSMVGGVQSVVQGASMVTKIPFPRVVLPISTVGLALVDFSLAAVIFIPFAFLLGDGIPPSAVWFPLLILVELVFAAGIVLFASALNVFARDVRVIVPLLMQLWLLLTPVMYPLREVKGALRSFYLANPMTGLSVSFRDVLIFNKTPDLELLLPSLIGAVAAFVIGFGYFRATERRFADVI